MTPGSGYRVRQDATGATSAPVTVHSTAAAPWDPSIYHQTIPDDGYSYLTTRDGTKLALTVHLPTHPAGIGGLPEGFPVPNGPDYAPPYPTRIEYSGYAYADPSARSTGVLRAAAPAIYQTALGVPQTDLITLPADPVQQQPTYDGALAKFEKAPAVRVLFDNGAGTSPTGQQTAGDPYPAYEHSFATLPVPDTRARSWYLGPHGSLGGRAPTARHIDRYTSDPSALPKTDYSGNTGTGGLWGNASQWAWKWQQNKAGTAVSYLSAPLSSDVTAVGGGAVQLWVRSSTPDVDLQATVSEVRDGHETFVQNGWLRGSERKLATTADNIFRQPSSLLEPIPTMRASDVQPMPQGSYTRVVIPLYFEGHAYRVGSRIRVSISAPNGTQPIWSFAEPQPARAASEVHVAFSPTMPSRLILPVVPGLSIPVRPARLPQPAQRALSARGAVHQPGLATLTLPKEPDPGPCDLSRCRDRACASFPRSGVRPITRGRCSMRQCAGRMQSSMKRSNAGG